MKSDLFNFIRNCILIVWIGVILVSVALVFSSNTVQAAIVNFSDTAKSFLFLACFVIGVVIWFFGAYLVNVVMGIIYKRAYGG